MPDPASLPLAVQHARSIVRRVIYQELELLFSRYLQDKVEAS